MEFAGAAGADIRYEVCDVLEIDPGRYGGYFDIVFMEGGILHYLSHRTSGRRPGLLISWPPK